MLPKLLKYKITCIILCPIQKKKYHENQYKDFTFYLASLLLNNNL